MFSPTSRIFTRPPDSNRTRTSSPEQGAGVYDKRSLRGLAVLIVDDDEDVRELLEAILAGAGATVIVATSAAEALAVAKVASLDIIVSDIGMPEKDGYELMREIRALPHHPAAATPAIALTAFARPQDRDLALAAGFQLHVTKPCSPSKLVEVVKGLAVGEGQAPTAP